MHPPRRAQVSLASNALNLLLDPILIFGARMGVAGAALATAASEIGAGLLYTLLLLQRKLLRLGAPLRRPCTTTAPSHDRLLRSAAPVTALCPCSSPRATATHDTRPFRPPARRAAAPAEAQRAAPAAQGRLSHAAAPGEIATSPAPTPSGSASTSTATPLTTATSSTTYSSSASTTTCSTILSAPFASRVRSLSTSPSSPQRG